MTVTAASFRADFREFSDQSIYPDMVINYWLAIARVMLGIGGSSPPVICSFVGSVAGNTLTLISAEFGSVSLMPLLLNGNNVPAGTQIIAQLTGPPGGPGTYRLNMSATIGAEDMVAVQSGLVTGSNPFWGAPSIVATSPPTTIADFATEMWVAHQIVLEKQAFDAASRGGDPGTKIGVIASKSVDGVSVSFDISSVTELNGGYYNQTMYGMRFWRLAKIRGSGPIQIGIGHAPAFLFFNSWGLTGSYNAWAGPYPGIEMGDTGFG
jgi:hypothetical protein